MKPTLADVKRHMKEAYGAEFEFSYLAPIHVFQSKHQRLVVEVLDGAWHVYSFAETVPVPKESK